MDAIVGCDGQARSRRGGKQRAVGCAPSPHASGGRGIPPHAVPGSVASVGQLGRNGPEREAPTSPAENEAHGLELGGDLRPRFAWAGPLEAERRGSEVLPARPLVGEGRPGPLADLLRSICATAPSIVSMRTPPGVRVSNCSERLTSSTWCARNVSSTSASRPRVRRVSRSSFATTTVPTVPASIRASKSRRAGRSSVEALWPASTSTSASGSPCVVQKARIRASWAARLTPSRLCSSVETRT
jgi:hypothetical protein